MKKTIFVLLLALIAAAGCNQNEAQKSPYGAPVGVLPTPLDIKSLQDAASKAPKSEGAWTDLGNALMDSGRFKEAVDAYQKSLTLDPKNVDVRVDMGTCYRNMGVPDKAVAEYREALKINPEHPNGHRNLGVVLAFDLKDKAGAVKEFEKYLQLMPNAPDSEKIRQLVQELQAAPSRP